MCPDLIKVKHSSVKEEKVVNPPNNPTNKNKRKFTEIVPLSRSPHVNPIINEPIKFTANVPHGKTPTNKRCAQPETQYLNTVPEAPPIRIANNLYNVISVKL